MLIKYALPPEAAYSIPEAIAEIRGCADKLKLIAMDESDKQAEAIAQEFDTASNERATNFSFSKCQIPTG